ncbi:MAG TPA: cache domain-containing protein [archaeon]|nr:cache domain-containing protein [archaeon]
MAYHKKETHFVFAIFAIVALILVANFFIVAAFQQILTNNAISEAQQAQMNSANRIAKIFEFMISDLKDNLVLISDYKDVKDGDAEACSKKLDEAFAGLKYKIINIGKVGIDGKIHCSVNRTVIGMDLSSRAHIKKILEDPEHKPVLSQIAPSIIKTNLSALSLYAPVFDDNGNFSGAVSASFYLQELDKNGLFNNVLSTADSRVIISDSNGDILFYTKPEFIGKNVYSQEIKSAFGNTAYIADKINADVRAGKSGAAKYNFVGEDRLGAYVPVKIFENRTGMVLVSAPLSSIKSELVSPQTFVIFYMVSSAAALAGILVILFFLRGMVKFSLKSFAKQMDGKEKK